MDIENKNPQDMSVEEILKSIKEVINNRNNPLESQENEDILELTNIIENNQEVDKVPKQPQIINEIDSLSYQILQQICVADKLADNTTTILQNFAKIMTAEPSNISNQQVKILEQLAIELLSSKLNYWLHKSLPLLIKQIVEKEIQRIIKNN